MYLNARQLEQILRDSGKVVLPLGAKLTPAAQDLVRLRRLEITWDVEAGKPKPALTPISPTAATPNFLWWAGTKSGSAKAALTMISREASVKEMAILDDSTKAASAVRHLISQIKAGTSAGGILVVEHAGLAATLSNRSPHLRAIVGTSLAAVEAGLRDIAANVLILEPGNLPLMVIKNMILKFVRTPRTLSEELSRELSELSKA